MPKEKNYNPVQAQRKADKAREIKKGKAEVQARRNDRLAKRNPEGIKRQIDDLKAVAEGGGKLSSHEESVLEGLEKELKAVLKARELLGDKAPQFGSGRPHRDGGRDDRGSLGKRRRGDDGALRRDSDSDSDEVPEDVARIPMPRDTPPPIPKEVLDKWWAKRRAKRSGGNNNNGNNASADASAGAGSSANAVPLTKDRGLGRGSNSDTALPPKPAPVATTEPKVVYESKPVVRDLRKEAVSAFVPSVVQAKLSKGKGESGALLEPEEADRLEQEGYLKATGAGPSQTGVASGETENAASEQMNRAPHQVMMEEVDDEEG
ncbi:hypothetical protein MGG_02723 [Pyricularia oryzae 70-15]|uniref:Wbp11/ELF5/Saf1 N-terminal domain-containing protein n=3 Tax=Pyricularia oryzae TaxID=318829 RepID=G5EHB3_PYRO7|nr:uncharacterized protein MGG_02723 [Pyricularia oryzae 70-15]ELQ36201.1 hypothetical protein OOU_Y34scaffold00666g62 [Pyricularia oryzae Y34]KAI6616253.1 hypothetical protein MCOR14_011042 [Pyricularia oryzae]EAQ71063.1 hypothetical protein MGCH7_ch7g470 [Pyricularia oryzae 70-15]EHA46293.1 hypothetical protein MGG_02723 [Pyricularia oryzae 70-15]KAI7923124.1 hypothetical protein M9X92_004498 [Pyricularia oryzae]